MKQKRFYFAMQFLMIFVIRTVNAHAQETDDLLSRILQAVQNNISSQKEQIINYIIQEEIVQLTKEGIPITYNIQEFRRPPRKENRYVFYTQYNFDRIRIGNRLLTLPVEKISQLFRENGQLDTSYQYRYSNYRVFDTDIKIIFGEIEE